MTISPSDLAGAQRRCRAVVAAMTRRESSGADRAGRLADLLLELIPGAGLTACLLSGMDGSLALRPEDRANDREITHELRSQLCGYDSLGEAVQSLPERSALDLRLWATTMSAGERVHGFLVVGLSPDKAKVEQKRVEMLLSVAGPALGLSWELEAVRAEQQELERFALLGQAFAGLAHELNNALNSMMLQSSVVQLRVDEQARQELAAIRQHGVQAAALVHSLQLVVQERREQFYPVDLNRIVTEFVEEPELGGRVSLELSSEGPQVKATRSALKQLIHLLLKDACAGTSNPVRVATSTRDGGAALDITLPATHESPAPPVEDILWSNLDDLGRQAGQSLLRQLGGTLSVEQGSPKGWVLRITWG
jgi:signal transduction histidine kinase